MAELLQQERLQPSLLDRLTDDEPDNTQESRDRRVLSVRRLRECVLRDLAWLLNTVNLAATEDLDEHPGVAESVLNYGVPDLTGRTGSSIDAGDMEKLLRQALWNFEPRILHNSVKVRVKVDEERMSQNAVAFDIEGDLWAQPMPLRLYMRTELDLDSGDVNISEHTG